jgi:hypothetical protein
VTEFLRPSGDVSIGGWTDQAGGTSNLYQAIDEVTANDSDFIKSGVNPSGDTYKCAVSDPIGLIQDATRRIRLGKGVNNSTQININLKLMQTPSTEIASWDFNDVAYGPNTFEIALTAPQKAAITSPNDLQWWITASLPTSWEPITGLGSEYVGWFSLKDLTKMYQTDDTSGSGTLVSANGQSIGAMKDKSGNSLVIFQGTGGNRPVYNTTGLGASSPSMTLDGVNDYLWTGFSNAVSLGTTDKLFLATVMKWGSGCAHGDIFASYHDFAGSADSINNVPSAALIGFSNIIGGSSSGLRAVRNNAVGSSVVVASATRIAIISEFNSSQSVINADGTDQTGVASTGNFASTGDFSIGCGIEGGSPSKFAEGEMGDIVIGKNLTPGNKTSLIAWLLAY